MTKKRNLRAAGLARQFVRKRDGTGTVEFALLLPMMLLIFFGSLELAEIRISQRRVDTTADQLADLVSRAITSQNLTHISVAEVDNLIDHAKRSLGAQDLNDVDVKVSSLVVHPSNPDRVIVHWSREKPGNDPVGKEAYSQNQDFPGRVETKSLVIESASLIVVETSQTVRDSYVNKTLDLLLKRSSNGAFTFRSQAERWPRVNNEVKLCTDASAPNTCIDRPTASDLS